MLTPATAPRRKAPGPRGSFLMGSLPERRSDPLKLFLDAAREHGPVSRFWMGLPGYGLNVFLLNSPEGIQHVLQTNAKNYQKGVAYGRLRPFLGEGLLTSDGDHWRRQRRLAQPAFHQKSLIEMTRKMTQATERLNERWLAPARDGSVLDISKEMMRLTLGIAGETMFGVDVSHEADVIGGAVSRLVEHSNRRIVSVFPTPLWVPTPGNLVSWRHMRAMNDLIYRMIAERRSSKVEQPHDLLALLLAATDEESGERMTDKQLRDEVITIFVAGHETTAVHLAWTFYLLSENPEWAGRAREELRAVLGGRSATFEDLPRLKTIHSIMLESLRLFPPAWVVSRDSIGEDEIGGYFIPPKSVVAVSPYVTHRTPEFWPQPEKFDPARFDGVDPFKQSRFTFLPFGAGPRQCIGNGFAMLESQIILATILQQYELKLVPGHPVATEPLVTLRQRHGMRMQLKRIQSG